MDHEKENPLIIALDVGSKEEAIKLIHNLISEVQTFKVGLELFLACGHSIIEIIHTFGGKVFLDLKFYDIPKQVANACREVVKLNVAMFTVHASGGYDMMRQAKETAVQTAKELDIPCPKILGVTVLTSFDEQMLKAVGIEVESLTQVEKLATLAKKAELDGVVASPLETKKIRENLGEDIIIVTPGVRLEGEDQHDQKRTTKPVEAIACGSDYIVMGRSILNAKDPASKTKEILEKVRSKS